jgi:tRNA dimethylallyltransferase
MMKEGLLAEAKHLYPNKDMNALQTVGYQLFSYFDEDFTLQFAMKSRKHKAFCQATTHLVQA